METKVLTRRELWIIHIAPFFLGFAIVVTTWFVPFLDMYSGGFYVYRGYPFYWFITAGYGKIFLEFRLFSLIADVVVWIAVSSIGTLGILAFKARLKVARKLSIWILHLAPFTLGVIITSLTWFVVSTYLPQTRMPIFTTYRGYPLPWLVGFGNPGEEPLAWNFQLEYFIVDAVFWLVVASITALAIYYGFRKSITSRKE